MGRFGAVVLVVAVGGCTSVKMVQRDGCWVRRTERLGTVKEDLGPCAAPTIPWVDDRLTRLVQECVARADQRWHSRALAAWSRGEKLPESGSEEAVLKECMAEPARAIMAENATLKERVADVTGERDTLKKRADDEHARAEAEREKLGERERATLERLTDRERATLARVAEREHETLEKVTQHDRASLDRLADHLGEAAKKTQPPAVATATATSEGRAETEHSSTTSAAEPSQLVVAAVPACGADGTAASRHALVERKARVTRAAARPPRCEPAPQPEAAPAAPPAAKPAVETPPARVEAPAP
jgi:hypothetical protein